MVLLFLILFLLNFLSALGIQFIFSDTDKRWLKERPFKVFLLIPPVSITFIAGVLVFGVVWTIYLLFDNYLD
jgi:hypothetical protein